MSLSATNRVTANRHQKTDGKSGWRRVKFGDVVRFVKDDADPDSGEFERYVAGEHIETDSLHIRKWGTIGEGYLGPAFHRKFVRGQVLYGSRRTYLRKIAVAEFDGITANTTFVLEPTGDDLIPELLPFIMQTKAFTEHSIKQSKGSVNPYINFKDIAWFEFDLPPKDEQRRIAEILWAADAEIEAYRRSAVCLGEVQEAFIAEEIGKSAGGEITLADVLTDVSYGCSKRCDVSGRTGIPILRIPNVLDGALNFSDLYGVQLTPEEAGRYSLAAGDILIVRTNGNPDYVGRSALVEDLDRPIAFASYLIRLRFNRDKIEPAFAHAVMQTNRFRQGIRRETKSSAGNFNLNTKGIRQQTIKLIPKPEQTALVARITKMGETARLVQEHLVETLQLKRDLIVNLLS